jgi:membrane-associated protease RseP (regulator of RpoE activity)
MCGDQWASGLAPITATVRPVVRNLSAGGAAARADLHLGDRIVAVNGIPIHRGELYFREIVASRFEPERSILFDIEREGKQVELAVIMRRGSLGELDHAAAQAIAFGTFVLVLALVIAFRRPHDSVGRIGAWLIASVAFIVLSPGYGWASVWSRLPTPLGFLPPPSRVAVLGVLVRPSTCDPGA